MSANVDAGHSTESKQPQQAAVLRGGTRVIQKRQRHCWSSKCAASALASYQKVSRAPSGSQHERPRHRGLQIQQTA